MTSTTKRRETGSTQIHCNTIMRRLCYQADKTHYYIGVLYCTKCKRQFRETLEELNSIPKGDKGLHD